MKIEHKLLKENEVKIKKGKWSVTGHLCRRKHSNYGFHKSKVYKFNTIQILLNVKGWNSKVYKLLALNSTNSSDQRRPQQLRLYYLILFYTRWWAQRDPPPWSWQWASFRSFLIMHIKKKTYSYKLFCNPNIQ